MSSWGVTFLEQLFLQNVSGGSFQRLKTIKGALMQTWKSPYMLVFI